METKEKYFELLEIKVKNLLSELYETEAVLLDQTKKTRDKLSSKIEMLNNQYEDLRNKREELMRKYEAFKNSDDDHWDEKKKDFELTMEYVEGDKESFVKRAEIFVQELGDRIAELEEKTKDLSAAASDEIEKKRVDLEKYREELIEKLDHIRNDSSERWREIKDWFFEKAKNIKNYVSSLMA